MMDTNRLMNDQSDKPQAGGGPKRPLPAAAQRALAEAEARRLEAADAPAASPAEIGGRGGHDPARYGDWEVKGLATDF